MGLLVCKLKQFSAQLWLHYSVPTFPLQLQNVIWTMPKICTYLSFAVFWWDMRRFRPDFPLDQWRMSITPINVRNISHYSHTFGPCGSDKKSYFAYKSPEYTLFLWLVIDVNRTVPSHFGLALCHTDRLLTRTLPTFAIEFIHPAVTALIARFMGPIWGPPGTDRTQVGPMFAPWI